MNSEQSNEPVAPTKSVESSKIGKKKPDNKKIGIIAGAGVLGVGVIITLILVFMNIFGGSRVVCTGSRSQRIYDLEEEVTARFRRGVMDSVSYTGTITMNDGYIDRLDDIYEAAREQHGDSSDIRITRDGDSITMTETVYVDDRGNFRGANINFITFGEGGVSRDTFIERMERDDYVCR